ncbi:unnamed protein product [Thlaspi arvense]|uniref:Uncharacterized protein n=1 Tax=Thlaspi arvense TaxID=13288 RepID=A0AAU9SUZ2_THLAR|nr:unnamed protein product [Thlaspi arvense]
MRSLCYHVSVSSHRSLMSKGATVQYRISTKGRGQRSDLKATYEGLSGFLIVFCLMLAGERNDEWRASGIASLLGFELLLLASELMGFLYGDFRAWRDIRTLETILSKFLVKKGVMFSRFLVTMLFFLEDAPPAMLGVTVEKRKLTDGDDFQNTRILVSSHRLVECNFVKPHGYSYVYTCIEGINELNENMLLKSPKMSRFETLHETCDLHFVEDTEEKDKSSRYAIGCNTEADGESLLGFKDGGDLDNFLHPPLP